MSRRCAGARLGVRACALLTVLLGAPALTLSSTSSSAAAPAGPEAPVLGAAGPASGSAQHDLSRWAVTKPSVAGRPAAWARVAPAVERGAALTRSAGAGLAPCADDPLLFLCTTVPVPLDRRNPDGRMVDLHVEVFPHADQRAPSDGAVLVTCGGPGCSSTRFSRYLFAFLVVPEIARTRDLVFVDQRGVGRSDVINCPALQRGVLGRLYAGARKCHTRLGDRADLFSTTDVADDLEDVRLALGYDEVDLFGASYSGADMLTYAVRHPGAVRTMVLSSPVDVVGTDPFHPEPAEAMSAVVAAVCGRSPACARAHPEPVDDLATMARTLRRFPFTGRGRSSVGERHLVRVDENLLARFILHVGGAHFLGPGEALQAFEAHQQGDSVPLLRLAAENDPARGGGAAPEEFSEGHRLARSCVDQPLPWDKHASSADREQQFAAAYAAEPSHYGVFSKQAWAAPDRYGWQPAPCIASHWEDRPPYPAGTTVDGVPTLVMGGEYDVVVPESVSRRALDVMTDSTWVSMAAAGHDPHLWSACGPLLVQSFLRDRELLDTSCAGEPAGGWWVPGSFPGRVEQAPPARQTGGEQGRRRLRRLVTATVWTALDSVQHNFHVPGDSVALRGGIVDWDPTPSRSRWRLERARFTRDLVVEGVVTSGPTGRWRGRLEATERGWRSREVWFTGRFLEVGSTLRVHVDDRTFSVPSH